jgi:hypothetical protein
MAEPHWTSYVAMATGIAGAIMGFLGYRRSTLIKALDLRLELRKADNELIACLGKLQELLPYANRSRQAVAAATSGVDSGAMVLWKQGLEADSQRLADMKAQQPDTDATYAGLTPDELESKLVHIHRLQGIAMAMVTKYESALHADDDKRRQIREDWRSVQDRAR